MKFFLLPLLFLCTNAFSQAIEIEIQGVRHSCTPIYDGGYGQGARRCAEVAYKGPFTKEEALKLCQGAMNEMPAHCAIRAYSGSFTKEEALNMCIGATSMGRIDCVEAAYDGPFTKEESMRLCSHPRADIQTAQCALEAYRGSYTKEEAIRLCQIPNRRWKKVYRHRPKPSKSEMGELIKEVNLKAFRLNEYK